MHYVYILYSPSHDKYYVGESVNADERLLWHNERSISGYTKPYRPWMMVRKIEVVNYSTARKIENYIKRQKKKSYVKRIVLEDDLVNWIIDKFNGSVD